MVQPPPKTDDRSPTPHEHLERLATLGTLAASSAHEVNNLVTQLLASLHHLGVTVDRLPVAGDQRQALDRALAASTHCGRRLRALARGMTSCACPPTTELSLMAITDALDEAIELVAPELKQHAILERDYAPALPPLRANPGKLCQVFLNLLVNAIHAVESDRCGANHHVYVTARVSDGRLRVDIRDTGPGIAPERLGRVFEPFFTTKPPGTGTGLGLAVSRDIVTELGGNIIVQSTPGHGATFSVLLPRA